jgi:hypothetical protein
MVKNTKVSKNKPDKKGNKVYKVKRNYENVNVT